MADEFRTTFFFGPEDVPERPGVLRCLFNTKKRSWKGGIQVAVELAEAQLERLRERGLLGELLEMLRARVEPETFGGYEQRARDLFTQQICRVKLDLAIEKGLAQENQAVGADAFQQELDQAVVARADAIRQVILAELDV
ncbi:MAG: hypothetical protein D4R81_06300 [Nitrospiraceae bacterium]|nr:MAG: hypothetical protein D4R81_06300 [Nitrospiraceae bacterium]